jgi:transposase
LRFALDAEALLRALMAWSRGERRVCSMVRPPSPEAEDARRPSRERQALLKERIRHTNRIALRRLKCSPRICRCLS